jgi:ribonuclease T2
VKIVAALATLLMAAPLHAQAYQCRLPGRVSVPQVTADAPARRSPIAGYTLGVSWAPEYCRGHESAPADAIECSGRNGRFGLVAHGLWPEGRRLAPQWCPSPRKLSPQEARRNLCMTPSAWLLAHEWAKHGACMARTPERYFRITRILWDGLRWPDIDRLSREEGLDAGMLRSRLAAANPGWKAEAIGLLVSERGWLRELRLCYDRRFMPMACDAFRFGPKDSAPLKIWRGL